MIRILKILSAIISLSCLPAAAQMSVGASSQMQIGWSGYNKSVNRYTNINQRGTSGENILPESGENRFQIYGTKFKVNDESKSFDYASTANDNLTVTDVQENNFSVVGNYNGTPTRSTKPSLGWFDQGNSRFSR